MPNIPVEGDMEGFGLVCLEASLCGVPVFASAIGGITDAVRDGENGVLMSPQNESAWASALNNLMENSVKDSLKTQAAKSYSLAHFSWQKMVYNYWQHFQAIT